MIQNIGDKHNFFMDDEGGEGKEPYEAPMNMSSNGNVSSKLIQMLNEQLAHEAYNSRLYLQIGAYLKNLGLDGIASLFYGQFDEENGHQKKVVDYLTDRNELVLCLEVPNVNFTPTTLTAIADAYLKQEQMTTGMLKQIARQAMNEMDLITFKWAQDMLDQQRIEEEEATTFRDKMYMAGDNMKTLVLLDAEFAG